MVNSSDFQIWNALYLKPRTEKKVKELLIRKGVEVFLPLIKVKKQYSDRMKTVEEPLLKSYIFVQSDNTLNLEILNTFGVLRYVYSTDKKRLAKIFQYEIDQIGALLKDRIFTEKEYASIKIGQEIEIKKGPFKGKKAVVKSYNKNRQILRLVDLGWEIIVENK